MKHQDFIQRFNELDALLQAWQWLWREVPFKQPALGWFARHPQWQGIIDALDDASVQRLIDEPDALYRFAREQLGIDIDARFYVVDRTSVPTQPYADPLPGIRTRKWQQLQAFAAALRAQHKPPSTIIEWCAGKAHLSRVLLNEHVADAALALEINPQLIADGNLVAQHEQLPLQLMQQDVLEPSVVRFCTEHSRHVALHACGKLHTSLLRHCSERQVAAIDLVPCCYHLQDEPLYQPLSQHASRSTLQLDDDALKLALQETVTAPANARRLRETQQQWRLGFDCLQRDVRQTDEYLPLPSMSASEAGASFRNFCLRAAALKQITLPTGIDFTHYEALGRQRFADVTRRDLIRQLFRRPLELWLVYDRCLLLAEQGYDVKLQAFCERALTPRNLWISATRTASPAATGTREPSPLV